MALALCLTLLPTAAFAEGEDVSISGGVIGGGETGGEGGGIYVAPGTPTEGGGGTYIPGEDTRTEIWCVGKPSLIQRSYDGTTDGGTIPIDLTFTDGKNNIILKERTGFTAKKTFDSADAGNHTVTVEIELIGDATAKYKLKAGEETFTIGGYIDKATPELTVSLSKAACTVGEKILPLLSISGVQENAAVTYYYTQYKTIAGDSECEGSEAMPEIDENTAISSLDEEGNNTYYIYAKTGETKNYEEHRSATVALTVTEPAAASVTKEDGTDGGTYESLPAALNAAQDGDTVKLLADITNRGGSIFVSGGPYTLDLNGHRIDASGRDLVVGDMDDSQALLRGELTVKDSSTDNAGYVQYLKLWNGDLTVESGNFHQIIETRPDSVGTITVKGGTVEDVTHCSPNVTFRLSGGTFGQIRISSTCGKNVFPSDLLADNKAFFDKESGNLINGYGYEAVGDVVVNDHTHTLVDGSCACGYTCPHTSVDESGACTVCGKQFAASITEGNDVTYYDLFDDALVYAFKNDGCTLKLLADVTGAAVMINNPFLFDLNGHNVDALSVDARATIKDSGTEKGKIGKVTVSNDKVTDLTLGDLLEAGYAFKYETGHWANDSHLRTSDGLKVTVEKAPIQSVKIYAKDKNHKEVPTTMAYGTTGEVTLVSSCRMGETSGADLTYLWYKIEGAAATAPLEGATGANYTLPDNLAAGTHTYLLICTSDGYSKSAEITITVTKIDLANATVTISDWPKGGQVEFVPSSSAASVFSPFFNTIKVAANGKEEYKLSDDDYTYDGATATHGGKYTLTITATDSCANYTGSKTFDWEVVPYALPAPVFEGNQTYTKTYDGTTTLPEKYTFQALFPDKGAGSSEVDWREDKYKDNYEVNSAEFVSPDAGENKPINQTITLKNENFVFAPTINIVGITATDKTITYKNFTLSEAYPTLGTTFNIEKATMPDVDNTVTLDIINDLENTYTIDLPALPALESPKTYGDITYTVASQSLEHGYATLGQPTVKQVDGKYQLCLTVPAVKYDQETSIGTILVKVTTTNYNDVVLTVNLQAVNKRKLGMFVSVATDPVVYGMTLGDIKLSAEATDGGQVIPGTIAWEDPLTTVPAAGRATYRWTFTPDDTMHYLTASNTIHFLVDKATPTGAPTYTAITAGGKTLADAALTANASWPSGTVQWVDKDGKPLPASTQVQANTEYTWSFTPADADNYNGATGSVTLYAVTSGGGSSSGGFDSNPIIKTETKNHADGSTTKTETKKDGTVIETTTGKDGSVTKTESKPDGSSVTENNAADGSTGTVKTDKHGQTTAEAKISDKAVSDAKNSGEAVKVPTEVKAGTNSDSAPTVKIELPRNSGATKVEIPVSNVTPGTVAVLVHPDGTEEIVKNSLPTEDGIQLTVDGNATVKIVDNSKDFADTQNHWAKDAIDFVSARGLVNGMSATIYAPNNSTTRAQLWTILARQNDADLSGGANWYEKAQLWSKDKGISDGTNPNAAINRAQMVTMLWRAMGQSAPAAATTFTDVSADAYYASAVSWAVEHGITTGVGGGRFDPAATCTRAQIAAFLARSMK